MPGEIFTHGCRGNNFTHKLKNRALQTCVRPFLAMN
jgi:hypothetical protein